MLRFLVAGKVLVTACDKINTNLINFLVATAANAANAAAVDDGQDRAKTKREKQKTEEEKKTRRQ